MDEGGSRAGTSLSDTVPWRGLRRVELLNLGPWKDMIRKAPDKGISLHKGPFMSEGNLESGGGLIYRGL